MMTHDDTNDSTRAQINNIPEKSHVIPLLIACVDTPRSRFVTWLQSNPHAIHFKRPKTRRIMGKLEGAANGHKKSSEMVCIFNDMFIQC